MLACRSAERGARLVAELRAEHAARGLSPPSLEVRLLDLASLSSVRAFCEAFRASQPASRAIDCGGGGEKQAGGGGAGRGAPSLAPPPARPAHVLVCNAGVFNMGVRERRVTAEGGLEEHMACNHLGHFLLAVLMLPCLREGTRGLRQGVARAAAEERAAAAAAGARQQGEQGGRGAAAPATPQGDSDSPPRLPRARIVSVSSAMHHYGASLGRGAADRADPQLAGGGGARRGAGGASFSADRAYGRSKLAQLLFTRELRRRVGADELDALALHPGMVVTDVVRSLPAAVGAAYRALMGRLLLSPDEGARASVFAATALEPVPHSPASSSTSLWYLDANALPVAPCPVAECPETAAWLWRWSAEVVGLREGEDVPPRSPPPAKKRV